MAVKNRVFLLALIVLGLSILYVFLPKGGTEPAAPVLPGRNNTALFITTEASGLSNVHLAATTSLLEKHPSVEIHFASFPKLREKLNRISSAAEGNTRPIEFHELPGLDMTNAVLRQWKNFDYLISPPAFRGLKKTLRDYGVISTSWEPEEHYAIYKRLLEIVEEVDPAIIVLDAVFAPAGDLVANVNRRFTFLSPNTANELFAMDQPWGAGFWKYPALASGYPYPVPWNLVPSNIWLQIRMIVGLLTNPRIVAMQKYLKGRGVKNPIQPGFGVPGVPAIIATFPEANLPLEVVPDTTRFCGPVVADAATVEEQDPELASWLKQGPTMMVNLGSLVQYSQERASIMVEAIRIVLVSAENSQVLWKFRKAEKYGDEVFDPVREYISNGRLRVETWLNVDPISLLQTGDIAVSVHHGGAGCFHEAIFAGVPQVILPLWFDLYNAGRTVEYLGIGIWPGQEVTPDWEAESLAKGFLEALTGESSKSLQSKARSLAETARNYGGRHAAANYIADIAAQGQVSVEV
ncbi:unnamed protein product [Clonostachys rosea f. rosea IK726]|uniref:Erythromycin biosynthesis protein CIII-like C-terminal domain-containing protein n=2 Tax=Bionectria ochroleuca TaxID=29856 RepID=A0A0B7KGQ2_BIOOC|nr:unnamed protein product [Clonostachys rosea f. rosea IK726]